MLEWFFKMVANLDGSWKKHSFESHPHLSHLCNRLKHLQQHVRSTQLLPVCCIFFFIEFIKFFFKVNIFFPTHGGSTIETYVRSSVADSDMLRYARTLFVRISYIFYWCHFYDILTFFFLSVLNGLNCWAINSLATDLWCQSSCNHIPPSCPSDLCQCSSNEVINGPNRSSISLRWDR